MDQDVFLKNSDLPKFLEKLSHRYDVVVPVKLRGQRFYKKFSHNLTSIVIGEVRPFEPLKSFFTWARERVADGFKNDLPHAGKKPTAVVGVKACDLKSLQIQDFVFQRNGTSDPLYMQNRQENLIIAADCTDTLDTCFCLAVGAQPHPLGDFDLNLASLENGFVVEIGSAKGQKLVEDNKGFFRLANPDEVKAREEQRERIKQAVQKNLEVHSIPTQDRFAGMIEKNFEAPLWEEESKTCVECGACTQICPTCHCFLLYDQKDGEKMARLRSWDSCMLKDYARVAGGGNPRKKLWTRLRNRFDKKFDFFPKVLNVTACTGCGRCITACPAKIDIRRVLKRLVAHA